MGHLSDINGSIRVIASGDGQNGHSVALLSELGTDIRDPHLSVTPDHRIMLNIGGSIYTAGELTAISPKVSFSDPEGKSFFPPQNIIVNPVIRTDKDWLWRATWLNGKSYVGAYQPIKKKSVQLLVSDDGINYKYITTFDVIDGNETTLRFNKNNEMIAVVRRSGKNNGTIGVSSPPYKNWRWNDLETRLGGPGISSFQGTNKSIPPGQREYAPYPRKQNPIPNLSPPWTKSGMWILFMFRRWSYFFRFYAVDLYPLL